ncbi:glycosyltransferase [Dyella sp. ASV21]|uniref:glycosyltransferase n=1 Tax=Dyella sp. ASV21 TaxID=2795114 RepID=UPI0018EA627D|nr:glycosyltransferase [Dyella sp. ASV21]
MALIHLLAWDNQRGLSHDLRLVEQALREQGHEVRITRLGPRWQDGRWRAVGQRLSLWWHWAKSLGRKPRRYDVNIALETVRPRFFSLARFNLILPHPEWFPPISQRFVGHYDGVLTKTAVGKAIFTPIARQVLPIGFTSCDRLDPDEPKRADFLHVAGASTMKGTARLLEVWQRHPEWPMLTVLQSPEVVDPAHAVVAPNIHHRVERVPDDELRTLQNSHAFHLCLSETEGWGHYLVEAMSCRAVVITCDAPPMNELVSAERGLLVAASPCGECQLATRYAFEPEDLERVIATAAAMTPEQREHVGDRARAWFLKVQHAFPAQLGRTIDQLLREP